jgi:hypothetical protein
MRRQGALREGKRPSVPFSVKAFQFSMLPAHSRAQQSKCQIGVISNWMSQQSPRSSHIRRYPEPALDLIDQVGPGGEFMSQEVTAKRCRAEIWNPTLMDRQPWDVWEAAGSKTTTDCIQAKLKKILSRHTLPPLPDGAAEKIAQILREAEARSG